MAELVIFDCDGVLVDSETISVGVLSEFVRKAGADIGEKQAYRMFLGRSMAAVEDALRREFALTLSQTAAPRHQGGNLSTLPRGAEADARRRRGAGEA